MTSDNKNIGIQMREYVKFCIDMVRNKKFLHYFKLYSSIFIISTIISSIIGFKIPDISNGTIFFIKNYTSLRFGDGGIVDLLSNNFFISLILVYAFYSSSQDDLKYKKFLGVFYFSYMGAITGLVTSKVIVMSNLVIALSMIVPHGIIEIPTIIYAVSSGWALSEQGINWSKVPKELVYTVITIFILLGIAAYIEANITMIIYEMALSYYS